MIALGFMLCAALGGPTSAHDEGTVAIVSGALVFEAETARALCPPDAERLRIDMGTDAARAVDVLTVLGSPTPAVAIDFETPFPGDDAQLAARARRARCLVLEGGTWIDWWSTLKPHGKLTRLGQAIVDAHRAGATVIGVDAAGAYLAQRSVLSRETLQRPSRDPHDTSRDVLLEGLGLASSVCVDMQTDGRASPERMLEVVFASDFDLAVWLTGPSAWIEDGTGRTARIAGPTGSALVFDVRRARRSRTSMFGGEFHVLRDGASFDIAERTARAGMGPGGPKPMISAGGATLDVLAEATSALDWPTRGMRRFRGEMHVLEFSRNSDPATATAAPRAPTVRFDWFEPAR